MLSTPITRRFNLATPIVSAGMAMVARPGLAAAVSNAGGLGTIGCDISPPEALSAMIGELRGLTRRPYGVDLIGDFATDAHIDVLIEHRVPLVIFFWTAPSQRHLARLKAAGTDVWMQVGSVAEADAATGLGLDALVIQGAEAGGHNRSEASTMTLFPRLRGRHPDMPMLAAGGIVDGVTMAAALVLGADAVWCGSRFLASVEADAHDAYKAKVLQADVGDTTITSIYGPEWPDQPMRALLNDGALAAVGREAQAVAEAAGESMGRTRLGGQVVPLPRYSAVLPTREFEGDIEQACLTAGQSVGGIEAVLPAAEIVRRMTDEAVLALVRLRPSAAAA